MSAKRFIAVAVIAAALAGGIALLLGRDPPAPVPGAPDAGAARASASDAPRAQPRGRGTIMGVVTLTGEPPAMKVPVARGEAEWCRKDAVVHDAVRGRPGRLQDVLVRVEPGGVRGLRAAQRPPARGPRACRVGPGTPGA